MKDAQVVPATTRIRFATVVLSLAMIACDAPELTPDRDVPSSKPEAPSRVVSLSPEASRLILALGAGNLVVAVDSESGALAAYRELPTTDLSGAEAFAPQLVLVPRSREKQRAHEHDSLSLRGPSIFERVGSYELVEIGPYDYEEAFALIRELGTRLIGSDRASEYEREISRELAEIGGSSRGRARPRVLAVTNLTPLEFASSHSFATDLIEIAGGESLTHSLGDELLGKSFDEMENLAIELVLVVQPGTLDVEERERVRSKVPDTIPIEFFVFDAFNAWMVDGPEAARRLRKIIESRATPEVRR
jgi:ABC-type Fe3+-hydroxamate transport system substrate-binding protein